MAAPGRGRHHWSHRWYVTHQAGSTGPSLQQARWRQIGDSGTGSATTPRVRERRPRRLHPTSSATTLGLRDYDTAGEDNSTAFWTLMSPGPGQRRRHTAIGTIPGYGSAREAAPRLARLPAVHLQQGRPVSRSSARPTKGRQKMPQALAILPDRKMATTYNTPKCGSMEWWGGSADNLNDDDPSTRPQWVRRPRRSMRCCGPTSRRVTTTCMPRRPPTAASPGHRSVTRSPARPDLGPDDLGPVRLRRQEDRFPVPLPDRWWPPLRRSVPGQHQDHQRLDDDPHRWC